ncbi:hypothetical protein F1880_009688 [Penicillium rolfsii]|nr:hypothetical protein F1880_009688 [Penicillium rolfsii]
MQGPEVECKPQSPSPPAMSEEGILRKGQLPVTPPVGLHFSGGREPPLTLIWGIPTFSPEANHWIQFTTGQMMTFAEFYEEEAPSERLLFRDAEIMRIRSQMMNLGGLPDRALVESVLQAYKASPLPHRYPAVEQTLFQNTIASAYNKNGITPNTRNASSRASARLVFMLAGHIIDHGTSTPPFKLSPRESSHARNLFWLCYMSDKDLSFRFGQPPAIDDVQCDLTLPDHYAQSMYTAGLEVSEASLWTQKPREAVTFLFDIRLSIIKSKLLTNVYSPASLQKSQYSIEQTIREIEHSLGKWRLSLPRSFQPPPVGLVSEHPATVNPQPNILLTWFEYYQCVSMLYLVRSHYELPLGTHSVNSSNLLASYLAVSVEASRTILRHLERNTTFQSLTASWIATFAVPLAALLVFWNILQDASQFSVHDDARLLLSASNYLAGCYWTLQLPAPLLRHLISMSNYVEEFHRLASAAISNQHRAERVTAT